MAILALTEVDQFAGVRAVSRGRTRAAEEVVETSAADLSELVRTAMVEMRAEVAALKTEVAGLRSSHTREIAVLKEKNEVLTQAAAAAEVENARRIGAVESENARLIAVIDTLKSQIVAQGESLSGQISAVRSMPQLNFAFR